MFLEVERQVGNFRRVVADAFELPRGRLVVEDGLAREADLVSCRWVSEDGAEHARNHVPEAVHVVVALHHVRREVVVVLDERFDSVGEHCQRDQPHTRDRVVDRQLRGIQQVLQDDPVGRFLNHLQTDETLCRITDDASLFGR